MRRRQRRLPARRAGNPRRRLVAQRTQRVEGPGAPRDVRVGEAGAFLLLYDGRVAANEVRVTPR